jgi:hypothetical protein
MMKQDRFLYYFVIGALFIMGETALISYVYLVVNGHEGGEGLLVAGVVSNIAGALSSFMVHVAGGNKQSEGEAVDVNAKIVNTKNNPVPTEPQEEGDPEEKENQP